MAVPTWGLKKRLLANNKTRLLRRKMARAAFEDCLILIAGITNESFSQIQHDYPYVTYSNGIVEVDYTEQTELAYFYKIVEPTTPSAL